MIEDRSRLKAELQTLWLRPCAALGVPVVLFYLILVSVANLAFGFALATYLHRRGWGAWGAWSAGREEGSEGT